MDEKPEKRPRGRPVVEAEKAKKHRGLSLTDTEWAALLEQAATAGLKPSAYVVKKLKLS